MLTVHHLASSQSERIVWLCEELELDYTLIRYEREPGTRRAPVEYRELHPMGVAPVITDGSLVLGESGAIIEYLATRKAGGRLTVDPSDPSWPDYLYWLHFANASMVPNASSVRMAENDFAAAMRDRLGRSYAVLENRLTEAPYFAGNRFTIADIMMCFPLIRLPFHTKSDALERPALSRYLETITARAAYRRAMGKANRSATISPLF